MATAKLTLIGMYNYDSTIFDDLTLPNDIDKNLFINSLLMEAGEFEVLYPDLTFLKFAIKTWGEKWFRTFSEWYRGTQATWNPIENYDRYETSKDVTKHTRNLTDKRTAGLTNTTSYNSDVTDETMETASNEHQISAYDSNSYSPKDKDIIDNGKQKSSHGGYDTNATSGTDTYDHTGNSKDKVKHEAHIHGNIGVTQSSEMLASFYDISKWNLYDHMIGVFKSELLICVY